MTFLLGYAILGLLWFIYEVTHQTPKAQEYQRYVQMCGWRARIAFTLFTLFVFLPLTVAFWPLGAIGVACGIRR